MADFHQNGQIATLHNLRTQSTADLERELTGFSKDQKIWLILPSLFSELQGEALSGIIEQLSGAPYIDHIVIGLDRASEEQYRYAKQFFSRLPQAHSVLWNDGPRLRAIDDELNSTNLAPQEAGKGRNVWYCVGYTLACDQSTVVGLHDCDITTYSRDMVARLLYPVSRPDFPYQFCKGYYARVAGGKLNGRVNRLLVGPILLALSKVFGKLDYIDYLREFRYALAGEFAMRTNILRDIRIPSDWGLEIGVLSEAWRNLNPQSVCQVEIADQYDHKHQPLSQGEPTQGLSRMSNDICTALYRKLAADGNIFQLETFRTLKATYYRTALDQIENYYAEAVMNGLRFDRHAEEQAVELFASNIVEAGKTFLDNPMDTPFIPNWSRINSAYPNVMERLKEAVAADNKDYATS